MWRLRWSIGVYAGPSPFELQPIEGFAPALTPSVVSEFPCSAVADPFVLRWNNRWYLFFEAVNRDTGRGEIACATSLDCRTWRYAGLVLREPFHLSYPYVFEWEGSVYMIPESRQAEQIRLYAAYDFPHDWRCVAVLHTGAYADASIFRHDGYWWMFAQRGLDELTLLYSERLEDGWTAHPTSPLWPGNRVFSRPGGRLLNYAGNWFRFAQDGLLSYGSCLRAMRIENLSPSEFSECEIDGSPILSASLQGWNAMGMHHLNAVPMDDGSWIGVVDGATATA